ncbi:immunoglobulin-like domain-containing protein [Clostridium sardiniense]|uniref:immunoglobulin-like domain-containing protein n=1 Tax=Clostridium sardiniense TaxID=29369 RepID=UPI003D330190
MKRISLVSYLLIILVTLISCSQKINFSKLEKSKYGDIGESKEISVSIKETEITTDTKDITLLFTNNSDMEYSYGEETHLEINHNGAWYVVPISQKVMWNDIGYIMPKKDKTEKKILLKDYYGKLESGRYRIINKFYSNGNEVLVSIEFNVK